MSRTGYYVLTPGHPLEGSRCWLPLSEDDATVTLHRLGQAYVVPKGECFMNSNADWIYWHFNPDGTVSVQTTGGMLAIEPSDAGFSVWLEGDLIAGQPILTVKLGAMQWSERWLAEHGHAVTPDPRAAAPIASPPAAPPFDPMEFARAMDAAAALDKLMKGG